MFVDQTNKKRNKSILLFTYHLPYISALGLISRIMECTSSILEVFSAQGRGVRRIQSLWPTACWRRFSKTLEFTPTQVAMLNSFSLKKTKTLATGAATVRTVTFPWNKNLATVVQMSQQPLR